MYSLYLTDTKSTALREPLEHQEALVWYIILPQQLSFPHKKWSSPWQKTKNSWLTYVRNYGMTKISSTASVTNTPCWLPERVTLLKWQGDGSFLDQKFPPAMRKLTISSSSRPSWQLSREWNYYLSWLMTLMSICCCYVITIRKLNIPMFMKYPVHGRQTIDNRATAKEHANILPNLLAVHGLSGCNTIAPCYAIAKMKILKTLKEGNHPLSCLGDSNVNWLDVVKQVTSFMLACYGVPKLDSMTQARANLWKTRVGRGSSTIPKLGSLPPTDPAFMENLKRAHFQICIRKHALDLNVPDLDPVQYGWTKDKAAKSLVAGHVP